MTPHQPSHLVFTSPLLIAVCLTTSLLLAGGASGAPDRQADAYFELRAKSTIVSRISPEAVEIGPDQFTDKLVEIRGLVQAVAKSEAETVVLLHEEEGGGPPRMLRLPPDRTVSDWPFLDAGIAIRALCRVIKLERGTGILELVIPVKEYDARQREHELLKLQKTREEPSKVPSTPKTSEKLTGSDLVKIYGKGLQYFNQGLSDSEAEFLASRIIVESRNKGLDARLFLAVVAMEGTFQRALFLDRGIYLGNQTARTAIARIGTDLSRRIDRATLEKKRPNTALGRALAARRRDLGTSSKPSRAEVEAYVNGVMRLWLQMSGERVDKSDLFYSEAPNYEAKWRARTWARPSGSLVGTWEAAGGNIIAVLNSNGSGVLGLNGEEAGRWYVSGTYLEFRSEGYLPRRFRWKVSDDRKALILTRIAPDSTPIRTLTMLRR